LEDDRIRALILAVGDYETLPDLTTVEPDAEALAEVLEQPTVGAYAVKRLDSPIASVALAEITEQLRAARRSDTLLIYFAGHGIRSGDELFLCARDTDLHDLWRTAIPVSRLRWAIDTSRLGHVMVIVDSPGTGVNAEPAPPEGLRGKTYTLLASTNSQAVRVASPPDTMRMTSAFTRALIDGLWRGEADYDNSGVVSLDELREFVRRRMLAVSDPGDPVVYMAAGPNDLRLAQSGRLTLLVRGDTPSATEVNAAFRQITSRLELTSSPARSGGSFWRAFTDGILSVFGVRWDRHRRRGSEPSAWDRLNVRFAEKYDEMGPPPNSHPDDTRRS
jgi:hypothetical protein